MPVANPIAPVETPGPPRRFLFIAAQQVAISLLMITEIRKVVHGGYGFGFFEDKTVLIPYAAPGETIEFSVVRERKHLVFGRIERIVEPSPLRREPECPIFGVCGGCHLQHVSYDTEIAIKRESILENLARIGKLVTDFTAVLPSPERYGYRNHAVFKVDEERKPGFFMRESDTVAPFPPQGCLLLPAEVREAISAIPVEAFEPLSEVRVRTDKEGVVHFWGLRDRVGPPEILMEAEGLIFPVSLDSFFQINRYLNGNLLKLVRSLPSSVHRRLLDLYCGVGFLTLPLSRMAGEALGIERDQTAFRNAVAASRLNHISNVRFKRANAEREIGKLGDFDLVVIDPPRLGMPKAVLQGILRLKPRELIFISCDPPTFARDAKALIDAGYTSAAINLVDLFPATYHAEVVALFKRS
jgi:23S rRNA (uracil1939-C5)-methyltransferase